MPSDKGPVRSPWPLVLLLATACAAEEPSGPPDVLLVTLDTTRADALGCYGSPFATATLDALAAEGLVFDEAYTVAPLTLPAHASLLTGLYPPRHGLRDNGRGRLPDSVPHLASRARAGGYATAAFVGAVVLDERTGLDRGFETFDAPARPYAAEGTHYVERPAREVVDAALAWLARHDAARPFFLWVHVFDPHQPYDPPAEVLHGGLEADRYRAEVVAADRELGRLVEHLRADGARWRNTVVAVAGDHGEALGEHGEPSHAVLCYQGTLRVPLILRGPGIPRGRTSELASLVDVGATLGRLLGSPLRGVDGRDLLAPAAETAGGVYFESCAGYLSFGTSPLVGWLEDRTKYLHSSLPELYDLEEDPAEARDLSAVRPELVERARGRIAEVLARPAHDLDGLPSASDAELRALGYAGTGGVADSLPDLLLPGDRPSPAEALDAYRDTLLAIALTNEGRDVEAEALYERVLAASPRSVLALEGLGTTRIRLGRDAEALEPLQRLVHLRPGRAGAHYNLGLALRRLERNDAAVEELWTAARLDPGEKLFMDELVRLLLETDRRAEARELAGRWEALRAEAGLPPGQR